MNFSLSDLFEKGRWDTAGKNLRSISAEMRADPSLMVGSISPVKMAALMKEAENAMLKYELSKIPKTPTNSLRDLVIGGGALGGGGLLGYYGAGYLGGEK